MARIFLSNKYLLKEKSRMCKNLLSYGKQYFLNIFLFLLSNWLIYWIRWEDSLVDRSFYRFESRELDSCPIVIKLLSKSTSGTGDPPIT